MPHHFPAIRAQMTEDIEAVLAEYPKDPARVHFGAPLKPIATYPHSVVKTVVEREFEGRSVEEGYGFEIELKIPKPPNADVDRETYVFGAADRLIMRLAPYDADAVPDPPEDYAGVGYAREVTAVTPGEETSADPFCSVKIGFKIATTVYQ